MSAIETDVRTTVQRVQLRRTKGWRKPDDTVVVARPSKWGNPFIVNEVVPPEAYPYLVDWVDPNRDAILRMLTTMSNVRVMNVWQAVDAHARWFIEQPHLMTTLNELRGKNLACWCRLGQPCHADFLLDLANDRVARLRGRP